MLLLSYKFVFLKKLDDEILAPVQSNESFVPHALIISILLRSRFGEPWVWVHLGWAMNFTNFPPAKYLYLRVYTRPVLAAAVDGNHALHVTELWQTTAGNWSNFLLVTGCYCQFSYLVSFTRRSNTFFTIPSCKWLRASEVEGGGEVVEEEMLNLKIPPKKCFVHFWNCTTQI